MSTLPVSLIQMHVTADKAANLRAAAGWIAQAADAGAKLVMLPEMFCCPYDSKAFPAYCEPAGGAVWHALAESARKNAVTLVGGSMPEEENGKIYNTCFIFGPNGEQIGRHRKMHLFDIDVTASAGTAAQRFKESDTLSPGDAITVVETAFGKLGVAICYDIRFPELARLMALQGARVLAYPGAFNMTTGPAHWEMLFRTRALDNQVFTLGCAPARDVNGGYVSYANSIVVSPWGKVLGRLEDAEGCLMVELDFDEQERVRSELPVLQHRRTDVYALAEKIK